MQTVFILTKILAIYLRTVYSQLFWNLNKITTILFAPAFNIVKLFCLLDKDLNIFVQLIFCDCHAFCIKIF